MSKWIIYVYIPGKVLTEKWIKSETEHAKVLLPRSNRICQKKNLLLNYNKDVMFRSEGKLQSLNSEMFNVRLDQNNKNILKFLLCSPVNYYKSGSKCETILF